MLDVHAGSAAQRMGLKAGDIIRALDNRLISTVQELDAFRPRTFKRWYLVINRAGQDISIQGS